MQYGAILNVMDSNNCEIYCIVTGKVQRVMYRDFVQRKARSLGLVGEVENMPDWSVRVAAQGTKENLEKFIEDLHRGSFVAQISHVDVVWREPSMEFGSFNIKY